MSYDEKFKFKFKKIAQGYILILCIKDKDELAVYEEFEHIGEFVVFSSLSAWKIRKHIIQYHGKLINTKLIFKNKYYAMKASKNIFEPYIVFWLLTKQSAALEIIFSEYTDYMK